MVSQGQINRQEQEAARAAALDKYRLYTLTELEPILGVTHRTLQSYVKLGKLKAAKVGGKWKVTEEQLQDFLNLNK
jgi:excisionase family DNA binding protein